MRLKKKTELRKIIKDSIGTTGSFDYIEFYSDGTWERMSCSTRSHSYVHRSSIGSLASDAYGDVGRPVDRCITKNFQTIELEL